MTDTSIIFTKDKPLTLGTDDIGSYGTIFAPDVVCLIVLPAIALSQLALSVRRERLSRPPQTRVPPLVGLDYKTAETTLHNRSSTSVSWPIVTILRLNLANSSFKRLETKISSF